MPDTRSRQKCRNGKYSGSSGQAVQEALKNRKEPETLRPLDQKDGGAKNWTQNWVNVSSGDGNFSIRH